MGDEPIKINLIYGFKGVFICLDYGKSKCYLFGLYGRNRWLRYFIQRYKPDENLSYNMLSIETKCYSHPHRGKTNSRWLGEKQSVDNTTVIRFIWLQWSCILPRCLPRTQIEHARQPSERSMHDLWSQNFSHEVQHHIVSRPRLKKHIYMKKLCAHNEYSEEV